MCSNIYELLLLIIRDINHFSINMQIIRTKTQLDKNTKGKLLYPEDFLVSEYLKLQSTRDTPPPTIYMVNPSFKLLCYCYCVITKLLL